VPQVRVTACAPTAQPLRGLAVRYARMPSVKSSALSRAATSKISSDVAALYRPLGLSMPAFQGPHGEGNAVAHRDLCPEVSLHNSALDREWRGAINSGFREQDSGLTKRRSRDPTALRFGHSEPVQLPSNDRARLRFRDEVGQGDPLAGPLAFPSRESRSARQSAKDCRP
jgi:hypothetical protein